MLLVDKVRAWNRFLGLFTSFGSDPPHECLTRCLSLLQYRPRDLSEFDIHKDVAVNLQKLVAKGDCPHTLFYGPPGAGKKTLILAMLKELFGEGVQKIHVEYKPWKLHLPSRDVEVEFATVSSAYHLEINPSDVGNHDRYVVQEIIKDMARSRPIGMDGEKTFKVLVLNEVDKLSKDAQHSLRRTMEKYSSACRLILCCNNISKVLEPVRSRCLCVRVASPNNESCSSLVASVASREGIEVPPGLLKTIVDSSNRNMRRALLSLEACYVSSQGAPLSDTQLVALPDWEMYIQEIAKDILREQSAKNLFAIRGKLYELIVNCIPPEVIIKQLSKELMRKLDDELRRSTAEIAAFYEHRLQLGSKAIFHLEAFVSKFMSKYKQYIVSLAG